jgi:hypothetical protein
VAHHPRSHETPGSPPGSPRVQEGESALDVDVLLRRGAKLRTAMAAAAHSTADFLV